MPFGIFEPASTPPVLVEAYTGFPRSVEVLGLTKQGEQIVVVYCQTDDEPNVYGWRTTCRNAWDVTDEIVGWMPLPAPIVRGSELDDSTKVEQSKQLQELIASLTEARDKIILPLMRDLRSHAPEQLEELLHALSAGFLFSETRATLSRCSSPFSSLMHLPDWLRQACRDEIRKHGWPTEGRVAFVKNQAKEFGYRYDFATNGFVYVGSEPEPVTDPGLKNKECYSMSKCSLDLAEREAVATALEIVGAEDLSDDGRQDSITVHGAFANAIISEQLQTLEARERSGVEGEPIRISRGGHLEIWCNGFYVEGSGVRRLVHTAARKVLGTEPEPISDPRRTK